MSKKIFEILGQMLQEDIDAGINDPTKAKIGVSPHLISSDLTNQGTIVKIGADHSLSKDLLTDRVRVIMISYDKKRYEEILKESKL